MKFKIPSLIDDSEILSRVESSRQALDTYTPRQPRKFIAYPALAKRCSAEDAERDVSERFPRERFRAETGDLSGYGESVDSLNS